MKRFIVIEDDRIRNDYDTEEEATRRCEELYLRYCEEKRNEEILVVPSLSYYEWRGTKN